MTVRTADRPPIRPRPVTRPVPVPRPGPRPLAADIPCPYCAGHLFAHAGRVFCADCPVPFAPTNPTRGD